MKKKIWSTFLLGISAISVFAQSGTNSPYSQYGLGVLSDQSASVSRGMNGLGIAYRQHNQVNPINPASYSAIDSLSFIFDVGVSGQITNFKEGGKQLNARNANFEYASAALRLARHLGMGFGVLPYTNVGYNYSTTEKIGKDNSTSYYSNTYKGSGGLHEVYLGLGWEPFKGFSLGVTGSYLWGSYQRSLENYSGDYSNRVSKYYSARVNNYKLNVGAQYVARLTKKDWLTLGVTYGLGHKIGGHPICQVVSRNSQTGVADTTSYPRGESIDLEIPTTIGAGLMLNHSGKLRIGADYQLQKWGGVEYPEYVSENGVTDYKLMSNCFSDRHKVTLGAEICPNESSTRRYFDRIRYRFGVSYATPYIKIINANGTFDGPKEFSASVGVGLPIMNVWNNRSILNISAQWVRQDSKMFITENTFRLTIGLTFNERWFDKWKVE